MNIILIGFKSSGKTTIGKRLAEQHNCSFYDSDELLLRIGHQNSCYDLFKFLGEKEFRKMEKKIILGLNVNNAVIALGGGSLSQKVAKHLKTNGFFIYLDVNPKILEKRILSTANFLSENKNFKEEFWHIYKQRGKKFKKFAHISVEIDEQSVDEVVKVICSKIPLDQYLE